MRQDPYLPGGCTDADIDAEFEEAPEEEDEDVCGTCEGTGRNAEGDDICQDCFK